MDFTTTRPVTSRATRFRTLTVVSSVLTLSISSSATSLPVSVHPSAPSVEALLKRALEAHRNLRPCYVEHLYWAKSVRGQDDYSSRNWLRWNDNRHYRLNWNYRKDTTIVIYKDGQDRITYVPEAKINERTRGGSDDNPAPVVFGFTYYVQEALDCAENAPRFARSLVSPIRFQGVDCWKLTWDPQSPTRLPSVTKLIPPSWSPSSPDPPVPGSTTDAYTAPFRLMVIGRKDNLVRKVVRDLANGETETNLLTYQFRKKPYPPSTFTFVPPPGATEDLGEN